jgi:PPM family protein phosphatase
MDINEPILLKNSTPADNIISAFSQRMGDHDKQEDFVGNYRDECFVLADGVGSIPHGQVAGSLSGETALWAYRHIRLRPYYWQDKKLFMKRIFRSVNMTVWQKRRETGFEEGMASTLLVAICGAYNVWIGSIGDSRAYMLKKGALFPVTGDDADSQGHPDKLIGVRRYGIEPQFSSFRFERFDTVLLASDGVTGYVKAEDIKQILENTGNDQTELSLSAGLVLDKAENEGSTGNKSVCLIKKVASQI